MNGLVLWEGASPVDGAPVVVVLTGLKHRSKNTKTGDMLQTWILRTDMPPHDAVRSGADRSICGDCPLAAGDGCYVRTEQAPLGVWKAYHRGNYAQVSRAEAVRLVAGRNLRVGAYGDPAMAPRLWADLTPGAVKRAGYTHQWRSADLQGVCMASVHTERERTEAKARGYRTFRTGESGPEAGEIVCPATAEGGEKTTCDRCGLCDGSTGPADARKDIYAYLHGSGKARALVAIGG